MGRQYRLKPFALVTVRSDGAIWFGCTYGRAFVLPRDKAFLWKEHKDEVLRAGRERGRSGADGGRRDVTRLRDDLLAAG